MKKWHKENSETLFDSNWICLYRDGIEIEPGKKINDFYYVKIKDASAVVAIDSEKNIILKKEYRYCHDCELLELPAGMFETELDNSLDVAQRELIEETGYISDEWIYWGATVESSAKVKNRVHLFCASNCRKIASQKLDETEDIEVVTMPLNKAVELVMCNKILSNTTAYGILRAKEYLDKIL